MTKPIQASVFMQDEYFSRTVTVSGFALDCCMVPVKEAFDVLSMTGESYEHWEAVFDTSELAGYGLPAPLADGTKITDSDGRVFQVNPIKGLECFRWVDAWHNMVAMRCKQITAAT